MTPERRRILFGTDEIPAPAHRLTTGPLSCNLVDGAVRRLTCHGVEIVRGIAFLIRDESWGTPPARLGEPRVTHAAGGMEARWDGAITVGDAAFRFAARLALSNDGSFSFAVDGAPDADILTNRAGFVLLHPAHFAGLDVTLLHVDGTEEPTAFPERISPGQPFLDLKGLRYSLPGAGDVTCRMTADLPLDPQGRFETEDQRNWGDASYKTYVGSLLDPWPYTVPAGRPFRQSVEVVVRPSGAAARRALAARAPAQAASRLPAFGIGVPSGAQAMTPGDAHALLALGMPWWIVEGDLRRIDLPAHLSAVAALAARAPVRPRIQLEAILPAKTDPTDELSAMARACASVGFAPDAVLPCPAPYLASYQPVGPWPDIAPLSDWMKAARIAFPGAVVGGGMLTNFTELNRKPPPPGIAFVSHTWTSIVHAADDASVLETLETLPHVARSVRALCSGVPYRLGPASIAMRSNPYGAVLPRNEDWVRMPLSDRDPRQRGVFGAAWTVGLVAALASEDLDVLALHASHGHLGVTDGGRPRPCYAVLAALARASGRDIEPLDLPHDLSGVCWHDDDGRHALIANLGETPVHLPLTGEGRVLDETTASDVAADAGWSRDSRVRVAGDLPAFAVAFLRLP